VVAGERQGGHYLGLLWTASAESWCGGFVAAWLLFLLGWLARKRPIPRALAWVGAVSYAMYLLHVPLLNCFQWMFAELHAKPVTPWQELLWSGAFLAVLAAASHLIHRLVEVPARNLGRRLVRPPRNP
jgi:peptidoglycan/LPS O-acetylase OafA/YrhL